MPEAPANGPCAACCPCTWPSQSPPRSCPEPAPWSRCRPATVPVRPLFRRDPYLLKENKLMASLIESVRKLHDPSLVAHESGYDVDVICEECTRSEEHTSELQSRFDLVCRLLLEKKKYTHR